MLLDSATPASGRASPRQARAWQLISGALCQRAWVQAVILVAVLVIVAAQLVRWAEVDNEQAEALDQVEKSKSALDAAEESLGVAKQALYVEGVAVKEVDALLKQNTAANQGGGQGRGLHKGGRAEGNGCRP